MNPDDSLLKRTGALVLFVMAISGWVFLHSALGFAEENSDAVVLENQSEQNIFVSPTPGEINGTTLLAVEAEDLGKVEFFLRNSEDDSSLYLGRGRRVDRARWELQWTTAGVPEGEYSIHAQLFNSVGNATGSSSVSVQVMTSDSVDQDSDNAATEAVREETGSNVIQNFIPLALSQVEHFDPDMIAAIPLNDAIALQNMIIPDAQIASSGDEDEAPTPPSIELNGKGPANTEIQLNIFSEPIVVNTTTDANGDWVYTLHDSLEAGRHEIYLSVQDEQGVVVGRSEVMAFFVPEAFAQDQAMRTSAVAAPVSSSEHLLSQYLWVAGVLVLLVVVVMLSMLRMANRRS